MFDYDHRYSQRAKTLLKQYNLSPAPFIVEIDHRGKSSSPPSSFILPLLLPQPFFHSFHHQLSLLISSLLNFFFAEDTQIIQNILGRLTGRRTVPNVILSTESIGGSDDLSQMHSFNKLRTVFEEKGVKVEGYGV
jgi:hypothetical protein